MTLKDMKKKVLAMIEELNPNSEYLTDDPDISAKLNEVTNQVMFELARMRKIPRYVEMEVANGDIIEFADIEEFKIIRNDTVDRLPYRGPHIEIHYRESRSVDFIGRESLFLYILLHQIEHPVGHDMYTGETE